MAVTERWVKVLDQTRCIGCHACTTACKSENEVPLGVSRTYVKYVDVGTFPHVRRAFQVTRCNQCEDPPCVAACPTGAMYQRSDGIVDFDKSICIGCKACMAACPYDAIFINPVDHSAEKCNFCAHRLELGLEPACVVVCPTKAILVGNVNDPSSEVARIVGREVTSVRNPEKHTRPKLYYKGAHHATLDPLAARQPEGGTFMWSQMRSGAGIVNSGHRAGVTTARHLASDVGSGPLDRDRHGARHVRTSSAAALLSYDVAHSAPWGWRVSLYTFTKSVAAGAYLVPLLLAIFGRLSWTSPLLAYVAPSGGLVFLGITGVLLITDLKHPWRFYLLFTHPQWKSWLVRGGFVIGAYGAILLADLGAGIAQSGVAEKWIAAPGLPIAAMAAMYTAFLFAQARARDLWQSPLLAPHLAVQAVLAGSALLLLVSTAAGLGHSHDLQWMLGAAAALHLLAVLAETTVNHPTARAHLALHEMVRGRYAWWFSVGVLAVLAAVFAPLGGWPLAILALIGLLAHEHAFVQAGQSAPLA